MKADLTRNTFDPHKHFTRVLVQQGRVQLDSDWNEQAAILLRYLQRLAADVIGPEGGPGDAGFSIFDIAGLSNDFRIGLGHYYVDGILCEAEAESIPISVTAGNATNVLVSQWTLDGQPFDSGQVVEVFDDVAQPLAAAAFNPTPVRIVNADQASRTLSLNVPAGVDIGEALNPNLRRVITYLSQPDYFNPDELTATGDYLIYLDVWERHITSIEDPTLREVALGGPDTTTRSKIVWQVKAVKGEITNQNKPCDQFKPDDDKFLGKLLGPNRGRLKAKALQKSTSTDPCLIRPDANYRGAENQLYRVEIHRAGAAWTPAAGAVASKPSANVKNTAATFKWSRENGSVALPIVGPVSTGDGTTTVSLAHLGRDDRFGLSEGDWVEIQDDDYVLQQRAGTLLQVRSIDRSRLQVVLAGTADAGVGTDPARHPLLRRWDHKQGDPAEGGLTLASDHAALIQESDGDMWLTLEDGVMIQFQPATPGHTQQYRTGDYWLIPARTATADVEWPSETLKDAQGNVVVSPLPRPPLGVRHHYAPLGAINVSADGKITLVAGSNTCRHSFRPLISQ